MMTYVEPSMQLMRVTREFPTDRVSIWLPSGNSRQDLKLPENIRQCSTSEKKSVIWYRKTKGEKERERELTSSVITEDTWTVECTGEFSDTFFGGDFEETACDACIVRRDVECVGDASVEEEEEEEGEEEEEEEKEKEKGAGTGGPASLGRMLSSGDKMHLLLHHGCRGADHLTGSALDYGVTQSPPYPSRLVMTVISADDEGDDNNDDGDGANGNNARTQPIASNRNELHPKNELIVDWRIYYRSVALATIKSTIYDTT
ncbi:hypothetical protein G5I_05938 [Acromyrmex echinatior]|uniref:Uncharacterized protein n=1 Tax=Acromyrmex echinatior TaxID=103372 RepID=F4WJQ6_ACREC|nr:hypothetical protein G5I_05938 [Acromyrmex echinatior]